MASNFLKPAAGNKDKDFWKKLEYALEHGMIFQNVCMRLPVSLFFLAHFRRKFEN